MGRMSRDKGSRFERFVAQRLRQAFPSYFDAIRRGKQSHRADEDDVTGLPGIWNECQDAVDPDPVGKLQQAINDAPAGCLPVAITHKTRARGVKATVRASDLVRVWMLSASSPSTDTPVTLDFEAWLSLLRNAHPKLVAHMAGLKEDT